MGDKSLTHAGEGIQKCHQAFWLTEVYNSKPNKYEKVKIECDDVIILNDPDLLDFFYLFLDTFRRWKDLKDAERFNSGPLAWVQGPEA